MNKQEILNCVGTFKLNNDQEFLRASLDLNSAGIRKYLESKGFTVLRNYDIGQKGIVITKEGIRISTNGHCLKANREKQIRTYRLKLWQKKILSSQDMDWKKYLWVKKDAQNYYFLNRETGKIIYVRR